MKRSAPLLRKTPMKRRARRCSQAKDAGGMTPQLRDFALRDIGCIVARIRGLPKIQASKHHTLTTGMHGNGRRRGEAFTVPINDWSHQGRPLREYGWDAETCREKLGPSYAEEAALFRELYPDELLLAETEKALAEWRRKTLGMSA